MVQKPLDQAKCRVFWTTIPYKGIEWWMFFVQVISLFNHIQMDVVRILQFSQPDQSKSQNFVKVSFTSIKGACSSYVGWKSFFKLHSSDILAFCDTDNIDWKRFFDSKYMVKIQFMKEALFCMQLTLWKVSLGFLLAL